ncbi:hypothetical protein [Propionivibrio dicarboxylicus]|uniref:Uncharacterized protein n=1 Tax=Propionivibrio dicarboxylicus TaxID=83767 RepID=A0A1G8C9C9_9RHOO|nr:hypothetical protein [Propionivibrio dicarboxylicus]SDH41919.1 hypothetical protein SAMN05660652_01708 [Propionivibrio dicarboxylicus]
MRRLLNLIRLRLLQIELDGYEIAGNFAAARRVATAEACLCGELSRP